jgi:hypothetical protein
MSCILTQSIVDEVSCEMFTGGIKKLWHSLFFIDLKNRVAVNSAGQVTSFVNSAPRNFVNITKFLDKSNATYSENFDQESKVYRGTLTFESVGRELHRHDVWKLLIEPNAKHIWVYQDYNDRYWLIFSERGSLNIENNSVTGENSGKTSYQLTFEGTSSIPSTPINPGSIELIIGRRDCSDSETELALNSNFNILLFDTCCISNHPDYNSVNYINEGSCEGSQGFNN